MGEEGGGKNYQETRFVRSLLRGITAALRNLPTSIAVVAKEYNQAHENHENDKTKLLKPILNTLRKAEILFFTIGFAQLLEIYAGVSLAVQYAYHFPIQMWSRIDEAKSEILALSNDWIWKDEELKMAGIGNPDALIKDILSDGIFRPFVPEGAIKRHRAKKNDTNDLDNSDNEDEDHVDLFEDETEPFLETTKDHAGSQPMINANETQLEIAEGKL